jgi:tellurite resistance protein TerC
VDWLNGFVIEFIFSIENVFIYHIVAEAFGTPRPQSQKGLFIIICCQIVFQLIFFMGLANALRQFVVLPYILGVWLLYVAWESAGGGDHGNLDIKESPLFKSFSRMMGDRLSPEFSPENKIFIETKDGRLCMTMLGPYIGALLVVCFMMEIDVTLTKIEEFENMYIAYTSSVAAGFCVPELFFVSRDLFRYFPLLKYGVSFILAFYGVQLLLHSVVTIPDAMGILVIGIVLSAMVLLSVLTRQGASDDDLEPSGDESVRARGITEGTEDSFPGNPASPVEVSAAA